MTTIVTRSGKGSPLTHTEVDTNFTNLNTAKLETAAIPLGTLQAPSISFLNYSTTGIYSPAGDELGVSMLGSDKIRIKSTGEIIINATASRTTLGITPRLQIEGSASSSQCSLSLTGAGVGSSLIPRLYLSKARSSVNAVVLEDDILGSILFNGGDGSSLVNAGFIKAEVDGTPSAGIVPGRLVFATVDTAGGTGERMIIKNNGNVSIDGTTFHVDAVNNRVGIGTSSPGGKLDVRDAGTTIPALGAVGTGLNVRRTDGAIGLIIGYENTIGGSYIQAQHTNGSAAAYPLYLQPNGGNVGIGTTGPGDYSTYGNKLVVFGTGSNGPGITIATGTGDTGSLFFADGTTGNAATRGAVAYAHSDDALDFHTSGSVKARIDSSGRLLVGTSSHSGANLLQVNSDALVNSNTVGRGPGNDSNTTVLGNGALAAGISGTGNVAIGRQAVESLTTGSYNIGVGYLALSAIVGNSGSIMIGGVTSAGAYSPANNITASNRISIGSTSVTDAFVQVAWTVVSDARDKTNFSPVPHGLDFVTALKPTAFQFKLDRESSQPNGRVRYGFKAQDILELEGENGIIINSENPEKLYYNGESLIPVLVNAIKELSAKNNALEVRLAALEAQ